MGVHEFFHEGFEFVVLFNVVGFACGSGDDERCTCVVDEDGVDFVHDGVVEFSLDDFFWGACHVVAQVVESEFGGGSVGDVCLVGFSSFWRGGWVDVDDVYGESEEFVDGSHPFGVSSCEEVVDGDEVYAFTGECVEVEWQGCDEGFAFAGCHFSDFALVEDDAAHELDVVVDHIPADGDACGGPLCFVDGFISLDLDVVFACCEFSVVVGGGYDELVVLSEASCGFFDDGEGFGEEFPEHFIQDLFFLFFELVQFFVEFFHLVDWHIGVVG